MLHPNESPSRHTPSAHGPQLTSSATVPVSPHLRSRQTKRIRGKLLAGLLLGSLFSFAALSTASAQTAMQTYVEAMQPGTNWGNTLDASPNRHSWGAPETTQPMIQGLVAKGYKSLRIPVTWSNYLGPAPDYTIDPAFMDHVQQVVDWSLDAGLYVMLNMHHDSFWLDDLPQDHDGVLDRYKKTWLQIATRFKDRSNKLMFESINEPGFRNASGQELPEATMAALLHEVNTEFHTLIRGTGGANATRPLVLPTVYTRSDQPMLDSLKATITGLNDPNLIATVHYYGWFPFSVNLGNEPTFDETSIEWVHKPFDDVYNTLVADGISVVVGEFSVLSGGWIQRGEQLKYHEYVQAYGRSKDMAMMLWDTGGIYNRYSADWNNPDLGNIMMQAVVGRAITAESDLLFIDAAAPVEDRIVAMHLNGNTLVAVEDNGTTLTPLADYTVSGDTLTLKAHVLAKYATGAYGEKATLKLHADSGPAWKIFVRYCRTPAPSEVTTTTKVAFSIPVAFNGDQLATMESKHANGSNVGPINWTSFQEFGADFRPNYNNNTVEFTANFFKNTPPGIVDLDFHFWSGKVLHYQLEIVERSSAPGTEFVIYDDALASGWNDSGSWTTRDFASTAEVHSGSKSLSITPGAYGGVGLQNGGAAMDTSAFRTLTFWMHGGTTGGQSIGLIPIRAGLWGEDGGGTSIALPAPVANTWQKVEIPLNALNMEGRPDITGFAFQHWSGSDGPTFYVDDIILTTALTTTVMDIYGTPTPVITSAGTATSTYGAPFSYTITAATDPISFSATGLPPGLTLDGTTGVISGTPTTAGTYTVTVGATNDVGTGTDVITIRVGPAPVEIRLAGSDAPYSGTREIAYDGTQHALAFTTIPAGVSISVTYNGSSTPPTLPGRYAVVVSSNDMNYSTSAEGTLVITSANPGRLVNLSIRTVAGADSDTLIVGFVTSGGSGNTPVLVRAIGPTLAKFNVNGTLADPRLTLHHGGDPIESNDDWDPSLSTTFASVEAFSLPDGSKDAALAANLPSGGYTAHIQGSDLAAGIALGEIYDLTSAYSPSTPTLVNVSGRCRVGTGDQVLIVGFIVEGDTPVRVLIRAVGPTLAKFNVDGSLADPRLTLYHKADPIGSSDDWDSSLAATFTQVKAFALPSGSKDAALVAELPPGSYTAHVQSADGSPGIALVEVYALASP